MILFNTSWGIYSIPEGLKYTPACVSINNENLYIPSLYLSSRFVTYAAFFCPGKLSLEKTLLKPDL